MRPTKEEHIKKSRDLKEATKGHLDFLFHNYSKGIVLEEAQIKLLKRHGYIEKYSKREYLKKRKELEEAIDATATEKSEMWGDVLLEKNILRYGTEIESKSWKPKSVLDHTASFVNWIESMTFGSFNEKIFFREFDIYKTQAAKWAKDILSHNANSDQIEDFRLRELDRCKENTLYAANKYGYLFDGDIPGGRARYKAKEHHAVIFYLLDCGYSVALGKGRQIGATSALGIAGAFKILLNTNFFLKFVAEDEKTVEEIFRDKVKAPYAALPIWFKAHVDSFSGSKFALGKKDKKTGSYGFPNSRIEVVPPSATAINGGSPNLVYIDEVGQISILTEMINEGRPTMFAYDESGNLVMKRQIILWGTGAKTDKGKGAYEREWYRLLSLWNDRQFQTGIIPLFFSWHTRCSKSFYHQEKKYYYGARAKEKEIDLESSKIQFNQHYPTTYKDMFLTTMSSLVSQTIVQEGKERCRNLSHDLKPIHGRFEPIYDYNCPMDENSDTPYKIIDAKFEPIDEDDDRQNISASIFLEPERWKHRYFQGTDPIESETGHSKLASVIWDDYYKCPACIVNYRKQHNHKDAFLQAMLAGIYYDTSRAVGKKIGVPELLESNIGTAYRDYKESKGFLRSLIINTQLPKVFQGGAKLIGMDNKAHRAGLIISKMTEVINNYSEKFYFSIIYRQLDTFVMKITKTGKETWECQNKSTDFDDVLFALTFSYIATTITNKIPEDLSSESKKDEKTLRVKWIVKRDANNNLYREPERISS